MIITLTTVGAEEARQITERIRNNVESLRQDLLLMYTREGWRALGYSSWHEYLTKEFDIHHSYLRRQTAAALLEDNAGSPIGENKESHLRPIIETFPDSQQQAEVYRLAVEAGAETAIDFRRIAQEQWVKQNNRLLWERLRFGTIAPSDAYKIARLSLHYDADMYELAGECSDPELVVVMAALQKRGGNTWEEILYSRCIPAFPEQIPLARATASNLLAWLDMASAEHKATNGEKKREYWAKRDEIVQRILDKARAIPEFDNLFVELDGLEDT